MRIIFIKLILLDIINIILSIIIYKLKIVENLFFKFLKERILFFIFYSRKNFQKYIFIIFSSPKK